ncbi:hypothetical protein EV421DRAFT_1006075 [Armillaria borealis]|uniref:Uncharacterized protein n=1 Tax=Armillaria borealis TaxID=47425 RepID=A0AA39J7N1_9AGAR|nr:hypothetical protein EV421DRAFT_1006075 [Armillaria borealis]
MASRTEPDIISTGKGVPFIAGQDELLIWATRKPDTTEEHIDAISSAIAAYVKARVQLESDRSMAQWNLVNQAQHSITKACDFVENTRVVQGRALWEMPSEPLIPTGGPEPGGVEKAAMRGLNGEKGKKKKPITSSINAEALSTRSYTSGRKDMEHSKSKAPEPSNFCADANIPETEKDGDIEKDLWNEFESRFPIPDEPGFALLTDLRDIIVEMEEENQSKAMTALGRELWCQLVFLNVHRGQSRTLNKTKVCKINISDWDLIPVEADEPCKTCGTKIACQWTNDLDRNKCRECHLQAKRCVGGSKQVVDESRKRKRASKSLLPTRRRRKLDPHESLVDDEYDDDESHHDFAPVLEVPATRPDVGNVGAVIRKADHFRSSSASDSPDKSSRLTVAPPGPSSVTAKAAATEPESSELGNSPSGAMVSTFIMELVRKECNKERSVLQALLREEVTAHSKRMKAIFDTFQ